MKTIYNRRQEPDMTRTLRREDTSYFSLYIKMAQPSIAMGEDLLCDPDPCLTDTFFQVPTLDRVQGRDLVIAGTKVGSCHRVLACTPFLVSSGPGQPTALYSLQSSCFKMASDRAKWSDYVHSYISSTQGIREHNTFLWRYSATGATGSLAPRPCTKWLFLVPE